MTRLVLHIGQPKTGTTTLQNAFQKNRRHLASCGVLYPSVVSGWPQHSVLIPYLTNREIFPADVHFPDEWPGQGVMGKSTRIWHDFQAQIARLDPDLIVLSGEGFFTLRDEARISSMTTRLAALEVETEVVAYLRSPLAFYKSSYQQTLRMSGNICRVPLKMYQPILNAYQSFGPGPLRLHLFEREALKDGDIVADFVERYCKVVGPLTAERLNTSLSAEALATLHWFKHNDTGASWAQIRSSVTAADSVVEGFTPLRLTDEATETVLLQARDTRWLRNQHGITFSDVDYNLAGRADEWQPNLYLPLEQALRLDLARIEALKTASLKKMARR